MWPHWNHSRGKHSQTAASFSYFRVGEFLLFSQNLTIEHGDLTHQHWDCGYYLVIKNSLPEKPSFSSMTFARERQKHVGFSIARTGLESSVFTCILDHVKIPKSWIRSRILYLDHELRPLLGDSVRNAVGQLSGPSMSWLVQKAQPCMTSRICQGCFSFCFGCASSSIQEFPGNQKHSNFVVFGYPSAKGLWWHWDFLTAGTAFKFHSHGPKGSSIHPQWPPKR